MVGAAMNRGQKQVIGDALSGFDPRWSRLTLVAILVAGVVVRVALFPSVGHWDLEVSYAKIGEAPLFANPYTTWRHYNYGPIWAWCLQLCHKVGQAWGVPFRALVRLALLVADLAGAWLLLRIGARRSAPPFYRVAGVGLYLLSPAVVGAYCWQAQFDTVPLFLTMAALVLVRDERAPRFAVGAFLFALAVAIKHFVVIFGPVLLLACRGPKRRAMLVVTAPLLMVATILPYAVDSPREIIDNVVRYQGAFRFSLYANLDLVLRRVLNLHLVTAPVLAWWGRAAVGLAMAASAAVYAVQRDGVLACAVAAAGVVGLAPATAPQYLGWVMIPAVLVLAQRGAWVVAVWATAAAVWVGPPLIGVLTHLAAAGGSSLSIPGEAWFRFFFSLATVTCLGWFIAETRRTLVRWRVESVPRRE